ncbi:MAG: ribosome silencing factor [Anaerolineae bacterium]
MTLLPEVPVTGTNESTEENAAELAHAIVDILEDRQASDIVLMDLRAVSLLADYFVLASADSRRQIQALIDTTTETLRKQGIRPLRVEGTPDSGWIILDYGSVVAHLFDPEARAFYKLEQLWKNAPVTLRIQ